MTCGCEEYHGGPSKNSPVLVDTQTYALVFPTIGQFYGANPQFEFNLLAAGAPSSSQNLKLGSGHFYATNFVVLAAGNYTTTLVLDYVNANRGAVMAVRVTFPGSDSQSVIFQDRQSNTDLLTIGSETLAYSTTLLFVFDGTNWRFVQQV